jgi:hypothetical protein
MAAPSHEAVTTGSASHVQESIDRWLAELPIDGEPTRSDLFNVEQLQRHASLLAASHRLAPRQSGDRLLARFEQNARLLAESHRVLGHAVALRQEIRPAAVWFLDNYYLIHEQIRVARQNLPRKHGREHPQLAGGESDGLPRVYNLALELIGHTDGRIDLGSLQKFVSAYQDVTPLKVGELWAIPIMLRLALVENLRHAVIRIACQHRDQHHAEAWAERVLHVSHRPADEVRQMLHELLSATPTRSGVFLTRFAARLAGRLPKESVVLAWLRQQLAQQGQSLEALAASDKQNETADRLSISNSITSLRTLRSLDWKTFVEGQSEMERTLWQDPADMYVRMSFASRDAYRHVIEQMARRSPYSEPEIAMAAVKLARDAMSTLPSPVGSDQRLAGRAAGGKGCESPADDDCEIGLAPPSSPTPLPSNGRREAQTLHPSQNIHPSHPQRSPHFPRFPTASMDDEEARRCHVGYYLVDAGRPMLEQRVAYRRAWWEWFTHAAARTPLACYLGAIVLVWLSVVCGAAAVACRAGISQVAGPTLATVLLVLFAGAASQLALSVVNWLCSLVVVPRPTLRLDFSEGIPAEHRALVAIPTMLIDKRTIRTLVGQLEARSLANRDDNLLFALVTDLPDADREVLPDDDSLVELARQGIVRLNKQYCHGRSQRFFLLHRPRKWNASEGVWMGEERKRGKLSDLNRLLLAGQSDAFSATVGDLSQLATVRYVITLDTDTWLPRDAGKSLVGCMAHPLNRPRIDRRTRMVVEGYGILQPRVTVTVPEASRSPYSRLFAGEPGIDPYTNQTSDVYQDVFGQGSFIGKGIYDVRAFDAALAGRFPANRVLSHDLIESCFARSGLVNDLELFEGFPSRLAADMSRRHRWIRGDWQIMAWLGSQVPTADGWSTNPLQGLSRWKIFDNLRRSLWPMTLAGFVLLAWILTPTLAGLWTVLAVLLVFGSTVLSSLPGLVCKPRETPWRLHMAGQADGLLRSLLREAIGWCMLPYTVHCHMDAIVRTLYRVLISGRRLLEWTTASEAEDRARGTWRDHYELMWACPVASMAGAAALAIVDPSTLVFAGPGLLAWLAGPLVAWWMSRTTDRHAIRLTPAQTQHFRRWARQTWHYFDTWLNSSEHWLLPDNVQESPSRMVAHRTSPTNIGMGLLADLAASDLGYLPASGLLHRCERTFHTLGRLDRYRGHFYNWYDTRTLKPIEPPYVSSVDSGNLWGALIVLRAGLAELADQPLVPSRLVAGLQDTINVIAAQREQVSAWPQSTQFDTLLSRLRRDCDEAAVHGARDAWELLGRLSTRAAELEAVVSSNEPALKRWCGALVRQCAVFRRDLSRLAFWVHVPPITEPAWAGLQALLAEWDAHCTLRHVPQAAEETLRRLADITDLPTPLVSLREAALWAIAAATEQLRSLSALMERCQQFSTMDFRFLLHPQWKLLTVGFDIARRRRDNSFYDLLASESRLASFLAISHGQIAQEHWFLLGRMVTLVDGEPSLLSWSGSMFEYLMPMLVMPSHPSTILDLSCRAAVRRHQRFARRLGIPWGISESCCHLTDASHAYRYRAFGVPGLGLDRSMGADLVIAPYASALAAMVAPAEACANLEHLERLGALSPCGFYDAVDYTPQRRPSADRPAICRTVMTHHNGMTLLALCHVLLDGPMQKRFIQDPHCRAHDLLLQERLPQTVRPITPNEGATATTGSHLPSAINHRPQK